MAKLYAKMMKLLFLAAVLLVPLVAFDVFAANSCNIHLYRSPDQSALMIRINNNRYFYLSLVDNPEYPAIQFNVVKDRVSVFDKQANAEMKTLSSLQTFRDPLSRQFQHYSAQFDQRLSAARFQGHQVFEQTRFRSDKFLIEWLPEHLYRVYLEDMPSPVITLKPDTHGPYYEIQSLLSDLKTQVDKRCKVRVYHRDTLIKRAKFGPMYQPLRSDGGWNPMDANSWTMFDRSQPDVGDSQNQAGPSTRGFRFARPISPLEPLEPDEPLGWR